MTLRGASSIISLQHLRHAIAAADHGSFRQAAEALLLRQSSLSRTIRQLEDVLEVKLFDRSSGGVRATAAGRNFLRAARSILIQVDQLLQTARSEGRGQAGRLTMGFYTSLSTGNLRAILVDFKQRFPDVELCMVERSRSELIHALAAGAVDVAVFADEQQMVENELMSLWSERILVALPDGHRLSRRDAVYWTDLRTETVVLSLDDRGRALENLLIAKLVSPADRPKIDRQDVGRDSIRSLVTAGFGVSLVTESDAGESSAGLIYREIRDGVGPSSIGYCAQWRRDNDNPTLVQFLKVLSERYASPRF